MKQRLARIWMKLRSIWRAITQRFTNFVQKRPFFSFFALLIGLFAVIAIGHQLRKPPATQPQVTVEAKEVELFTLGANPHIQLQAKVEKSGVVTIVAQSPGIVQKIRVKEGDHVKRGSQLLSLSTNYQGGNTSSLARQIAQKNFQFQSDNFQAQKDLIGKQKQIAENNETIEEELRSITRQSLGETESLINLNQTIIDSLNKQIDQLQLINVNGSSDSAILQLRQAEAGTMLSLNTARSALRNNQYQSSDEKEPAEKARLARDLAIQQLDLQEKTIDLNKDIAQLNLRVNQVNEALMYPAAPCPGTVERVFVKVGQSVSPGTPLFVVRGDVNTATAVILASSEIANTVSRFEPTHFTIDGHLISATPRSISQEPTDGSLHSIIYTLPDGYAPEVTNGSYIAADVPVGVNYAKADDPFVPLDAVYQTQENAYVLVAEQQQDGKLVARNRQVQVGEVFGEYVDVLQGVKPGDQVILNRNVIEGDVVRTK